MFLSWSPTTGCMCPLHTPRVSLQSINSKPARTCVHAFPLVNMCIKSHKFIHLRLEMSNFSFVLCFIPSLFQILSPDLTHFVLTLPTLEALDLNWAGSQHLQLSPNHTSIGTSLYRGDFERCMIDFQGCFIRIKTQEEVSRGTRVNWWEAQSPRYRECRWNLGIGLFTCTTA